jgi:hypothetical protein
VNNEKSHPHCKKHGDQSQAVQETHDHRGRAEQFREQRQHESDAPLPTPSGSGNVVESDSKFNHFCQPCDMNAKQNAMRRRKSKKDAPGCTGC